MSTLMKFEYEGNILQFEDGGDYPANRRIALMQIQDRTAAGNLQTEDLGIVIKSRIIAFNDMSKVDYDALINWYLNIVNGASKEFIFTDEYGFVFPKTVILNSEIDFAETSLNLYSGSLTLEFRQ